MHLRKEPEELFKQIFDTFGDKVCIAWSGGKSSTVVVHIALKLKPDVNVLFNDTGVEFPENIEYVNRLKDAWKLNLHVVQPYPGVTFWSVIEKYGLPEMRNARARHHVPKCCYYLKNYPADGWMWDNRILANITGLQSTESANRAMLAGRYDNCRTVRDNIPFTGQIYYTCMRKRWHVHPIIHWSDKRVWDYITRNKIPVNPVYTKWNGIYKRQGCYTCTAYKNWQINMSVSHPAVYKKLKPMWDKLLAERQYQPIKKSIEVV